MKLEKRFTNAYHLIVVGNFHFSRVHDEASPPAAAAAAAAVMYTPYSFFLVHHPLPFSKDFGGRRAAAAAAAADASLYSTGIERNDHCENIHIIH